MGLSFFKFRRAPLDSTVAFSCQIRPGAYGGKSSRQIRKALFLYSWLDSVSVQYGSRAWSQLLKQFTKECLQGGIGRNWGRRNLVEVRRHRLISRVEFLWGRPALLMSQTCWRTRR